MLKQGQVLEIRYKVIKIIEKDKFSTVYLGKHMNLKKPIIIKEIDASSLVPDTRQMVTPIFIQKCREYGKLNHPGIPEVIDFFPLSSSFYIIISHLEGESIKSLMANRRQIPCEEKKIIEYGIQLCRVIWFLHNQSPNPIIVGNLNPKNIIIKKDSTISLLSPDLKKYVLGGSSPHKAGYTAPEGYRSHFVEGSDIFSVGTIIYYLSTGIDPGTGQNTNYGLPPISNVNPRISLELERVIKRATEADLSLRFENIKEMKDSLQKCLEKPESKKEEGQDSPSQKKTGYSPEKFKSSMQKSFEECFSISKKINRATKTLDAKTGRNPDEPLFEIDSLDDDPFEKIARKRSLERERLLKKQKARYKATEKIHKSEEKGEEQALLKVAIPLVLIIFILVTIIVYYGLDL